MSDEFKPNFSEINMERMLNTEEAKQVGKLWKTLDIVGVPIDDIPKHFINIPVIQEMIDSICEIGRKHNLSRMELMVVVRCALFEVIWDYTLSKSEIGKQKFQHDNK
jgi:hypothetical protein